MKRDLWRARERLRKHAGAPERMRRCGKVTYTSAITLQSAGGAKYWDGVVRCRSRACPVCFLARRAKAAREIVHVAECRRHQTQRQPWLATLTIRHDAGDPVDITRQVRTCWRKMLAQRAFRTWLDRHGAEWIIAEEVTRGPNGWHPHLHALVMPTVDLGPVESVQDVWYETWSTMVEKHMGEKHIPLPDIGADLRPTDCTTYLTKLGYEMTDSAAAKGSSPIRMLVDGRVDEYLWLQNARKGARDITYSRGLRALRDTLPTVESAPVVDVSQLEWNLLRHRSTLAPLDIQESDDPLARLRWWAEHPVTPDGTGHLDVGGVGGGAPCSGPTAPPE